MNTVLAILLFVLAALYLIGAGGTPSLIGVQRKPLTETQAGARIWFALIFAAIVIWAGVTVL